MRPRSLRAQCDSSCTSVAAFVGKDLGSASRPRTWALLISCPVGRLSRRSTIDRGDPALLLRSAAQAMASPAAAGHRPARRCREALPAGKAGIGEGGLDHVERQGEAVGFLCVHFEAHPACAAEAQEIGEAGGGASVMMRARGGPPRSGGEGRKVFTEMAGVSRASRECMACMCGDYGVDGAGVVGGRSGGLSAQLRAASTSLCS